MPKILTFPVDKARNRRESDGRTASSGSREAAILLFTGIRHSRPPADKPARPRRPRPQKDNAEA